MTPEKAPSASVLKLWLERLFAGLFLLYPLGMASIHHYSSTLLALMVLVGIFLAFVGREKPSRGQFYILGGILLLICAALLSFFNAEDLSTGMSRLEKLIDLFSLLPLFYGAANCRFDLGRKFILGLLIAAPLNLGIAVYSIWGQGLLRAQGYYNPIMFGDLMMLAALLLLTMLVVSSTDKQRMMLPWGWLALFAFFLASLLSGTRGALLALPAVLMCLFWSCRKLASPYYLKRLVIPLAVMVLTVGILCSTSAGPQTVVQRFARLSLDDSISSFAPHRLEMWRHTLSLFRQYPIIGTGLGDYRVEVAKVRELGLFNLKSDFTHAHSIFFEYLAMTGVVGFVSMLLALFIIPMWTLIKSQSEPSKQKLSRVSALVVLVCFAVFGLTEQWLARSAMVSSFVVSLAAFLPGRQSLEEVV